MYCKYITHTRMHTYAYNMPNVWNVCILFTIWQIIVYCIWLHMYFDGIFKCVCACGICGSYFPFNLRGIHRQSAPSSPPAQFDSITHWAASTLSIHLIHMQILLFSKIFIHTRYSSYIEHSITTAHLIRLLHIEKVEICSIWIQIRNRQNKAFYFLFRLLIFYPHFLLLIVV